MSANLCKPITISLLLAMMISVSGCATNGPVTGDLCLSMRPIYLTDDEIDTVSITTLREILQHNETLEALCPEDL